MFKGIGCVNLLRDGVLAIIRFILTTKCIFVSIIWYLLCGNTLGIIMIMCTFRHMPINMVTVLQKTLNSISNISIDLVMR